MHKEKLENEIKKQIQLIEQLNRTLREEKQKLSNLLKEQKEMLQQKESENQEEYWNTIYDKADAFLETMGVSCKVDRSIRAMVTNRNYQGPVCKLMVPEKGNKSIIQILRGSSAVIHRGTQNMDGRRYIKYDIFVEHI